jgi:HSP20 family molecular chaperone IbpA
MSNTTTKSLLLSRQNIGQAVEGTSNALTYRTETEDKSLIIEVEVPGVDPADIDVNFDSSILCIVAPSGTMSLAIDAGLDIDDIKADIKWGLLTLRIPRRAARSVKINVLEQSYKAVEKTAPAKKPVAAASTEG